MYKILKLNLARNSLRYIIRTYGIKRLYIPYYLCGVMREALIKEKCLPCFYHIDENFMPVCDFSAENFVLYPNYFGICDKNVEILASKYKYLIVDNAHSFYSKPTGFACFNSARKFLPVYNGSYLWIKDVKLKLEKEVLADCIYNFNETEKKEIMFANSQVKEMADFTGKKILSYSEKLNEKRKKEFLNLHKKYGGDNLLKININECYSPFCYPFLGKNENDANLLADKLCKENYVIYRYWDKLPKTYQEYKFYSSLVCIPLSRE